MNQLCIKSRLKMTVFPHRNDQTVRVWSESDMMRYMNPSYIGHLIYENENCQKIDYNLCEVFQHSIY